MKGKTLFSIAMRVHRRPGRLRQALESVLIQNYDNLKLFCSIDDLNNDMPSLNVLNEYEKKGLDITCFVAKPLGFPASNLLMNELIKIATDGSWIHQLDDDDMYTIPDVFNKADEIIRNSSSDFLIGKYFLKGKNNRTIPEDKFWGHRPELNHVSGTCYMMKKELAVQLEWPPRTGGDYFSLIQIYDTIPKEKIYWWDQVIVESITTPSVGRADI